MTPCRGPTHDSRMPRIPACSNNTNVGICHLMPLLLTSSSVDQQICKYVHSSVRVCLLDEGTRMLRVHEDPLLSWLPVCVLQTRARRTKDVLCGRILMTS
jgi:hypothetical protein